MLRQMFECLDNRGHPGVSLWCMDQVAAKGILYSWLKYNRESERRLCSRPELLHPLPYHETGRNQIFAARYPSSHHCQNRGAVHSPHTPHTPHTSRQSRDFRQSRGFRQSQERWNRSDSINKATSSDRTGQPDRHRKPSSQFSQQPAKLTDSSPTDDSLRHHEKEAATIPLLPPRPPTMIRMVAREGATAALRKTRQSRRVRL